MSIINVQNLSFRYDSYGENIFENVTLQLDTDWRLGLTGRNGRGKSTFLHLLSGRYPYSCLLYTSVPINSSASPNRDIGVWEMIFSARAL